MVPNLTGNMVCGAFMVIAALLFWLRLKPAQARVAWSALLAIAVVFSVGLTFSANNLININVAHHYLGAKYSFPYSHFYELINAALEQPQVNMRDLDNPARMIRTEDQDQRAYYIDLIRNEKIAFDPLSPTPELAKTAIECGAIKREAERILKRDLPADRIATFRSDVQAAVGAFGWDREITTDYGYNGSPWYSALRHLDPTLYLPFGTPTALFNLVLQIAGTFWLVWLVGAALDLRTESRLAVAALLFSSWDYVGYALQGMIFVGLWLPIAFAVYFAKRGEGTLAGISIAWAGLIKLFPFVLVLPAAATLIKNRRSEPTLLGRTPIRAWSRRVILGMVLAVICLVAISSLTGRSWFDFITKIVHQFQSDSYLLNSVSLSRFLMALGITHSFVPMVFSLFFLGLVVLMVTASDTAASASARPRRLLVLVSVVGLVMKTTWFSYYAVAPLLLLPAYAQRQRVAAVIALVLVSFSFFLPDFDDPVLMAVPWMQVAKLLPYVVIPAWLICSELAEIQFSKKVRNSIVVAGLLCLSLAAADGWRMASIRNLDRMGGQHLDQGQPSLAAAEYERLSSLDPGNGIAMMNEGIAQAMMGNRERAMSFMAAAVELAPDSAVCRQNYGRLLFQMGQLEAARVQIEAALKIGPERGELLYDIARINLAKGNQPEAFLKLSRGLELSPNDPQIADLLHSLQAVPGQ